MWAILKDVPIDTGAFILTQLVSQASNKAAIITSGSIILTIAPELELEPLVAKLTPLFFGGRLNLAACSIMDIFKVNGGEFMWTTKSNFFLLT